MTAVFLEMLKLLAIDLLFVGLASLVLVLLAVTKKAAFAVLKRNFVGYFSNPTGYVFLCLFVLLTSAAAFWPHEFFIANLANLDQLNKQIALIMLVFIPAITMSIWAEERRQGTDELLLTLPAADFDIVIGKYLAAASIFTVSLLFSQLANYSVLVWLAWDGKSNVVDIDTGLFFTTYFGYWLMGLSMIAIGMVASFLTNNLTVSFILSLLLNTIPVLTYYADVLVPTLAAARQVSQWSFGAQFDDFGRGVISLSSLAFFLMLIALGIYFSMVLIGRRHWTGGKDGVPLGLHYLARAVALIVILVGVNMVLERWDFIRFDTTEGLVSSLSPDTRKLLRELSQKTPRESELEGELSKAKAGSEQRATLERQIADLAAKRTRPLFIDAYISANVPEEYVKLRYNLISLLNELESLAGSRVVVRRHFNLEPFSEEAVQAEERYGIQKQTFVSQARGAFKQEEFIMGAAFTSGLEKVVVPAFSLGTPVEYELVRSIATVGHGQPKRLGVLRTDAQLMGGFSFQGMQPRQIPKQAILDELEKQYKVEEVDPTSPIDTTKYDVLLAVQPSSLGPLELNNFVDAVRKGMPTAIFEDALPYVMGQTVGTADEKPPMGGGMFGGGQPQPKGDIRALWTALGIKVTGDGATVRNETPATIVWQDFNPYPKFQVPGIGPELVFVRDDVPGAKACFSPEEPVVAGFEELLLPYPTGLSQAIGSKLNFSELVSTSPALSGTLTVDDWKANQFDPILLDEKRGKPTGNTKYVLAAWIRDPSLVKSEDDKSAKSGDKSAKSGDDSAKKDDAKKDNAKSDAASADKPRPLNVIYVGDIDMLSGEFVRMRNEPNPVVNFRFDNIPFILNVVDAVAGDTRFLEIRKRKPRHSTLRMIEERASDARQDESEEAAKFQKEYSELVKKADEQAKKNYEELQKAVDDLKRRQSLGEEVDLTELQELSISLAQKQEIENRRAEVEKERLKNDRDKKLAQIQRNRDRQEQQIQNEYKVWATFIPPIPPLLVGLVVWARRRVREREGVSRSRMRIT
jgi:ABC-2 type transport system permease protein